MKIIICGAGQVGYGIAEQLSVQKNDVTVIDDSQKLIDNMNKTLDVEQLEVMGHTQRYWMRLK